MINYYQLLGLDPDEADPDRDKAKIRARIEEMRGEWSSGSSADPRQAAVNRSRLDSELIPDLDGTDVQNPRPEVWRQHRQLERERLKEEVARAETRIGQLAELLRKRGHGTEDDVKRIVRDMKNEFPLKAIEKLLGGPCDKDRVRELLKRRGVSFSAASAPAPKVEQLDPAKADPIFAELNFLVGQAVIGSADLYALLAAETGQPVGQSNSASALKKMADDLELALRHVGKTDPISSAKLNLFGQCRDVLGDEISKARYDLTLALRVMKPFDTNLRIAAGSGNVILPEAQEELIRQAAKAGISATLARLWMEITAASWSPPATLISVPTRNDLPQCGYCHSTAARANDKTCPGCGRDLFVTCPNPKCGKSVSTIRRFCECKYAIGDAPVFTARLEEAKRVLAAGDAVLARELVLGVLEGWPGYPRALEIVKQIDTASAALAQLAKDIDALLVGNKGYSARERLNEPAAGRLPHRADLLKRADQLLADATREVTKGRGFQATGRADDAIDCYEQALRVCVDHPEARTAMATCPPAAPTKLELATADATATLRWMGSSARGTLRYRVVRKSGTTPRTPDDGTVVGTITGTTLTDPELPVGEAVYYAVYTQRGDAHSNAAAIAPAAFRVADVSALRAVGRDGCVELRWNVHPKATSVEVWRKVGRLPERRGDGELVRVVSAGHASDLGLTNGQVYGYRAVALFRGPDGTMICAENAEVAATPVALPPLIADLSPMRVGNEVEATWTPPKAATVAVFVTRTKPTRDPGMVLAATDLDSLGARLASISPGRARGVVDAAPVLYLIPVSVAGGTAVVGHTVRLATVPDVANMHVRFADLRLVCRWDWPAGVNTAVIAWRTDGFPTGPADRLATRQQCHRFHYDQHGGFTFSAPIADRLFLVVYAATPVEDEVQYGPGGLGARREVPLRACARIRYAVKEVRRFLGLFGPTEYQLDVSADVETTLPELVLVGRANEVPLDRDDGKIVYRIPAGAACGPDKPYTIRWPTNQLSRKPRFRLFPADPEDGAWLDLDAIT